MGFIVPMLAPVQVLEQAESDTGGFKLASASIAGRGVYGQLKFESGVHRVQRVPATESSGRVHTSAASVAVMPQADEVRFSCQPAWQSHRPALDPTMFAAMVPML